jgi:hypothetical protein
MLVIYNLGSIRQETLDHLNDSNGGMWPTSELNGYVNQAALRVAMDTRATKSEAPMVFGALYSTAFLPGDCLVPEFIYTDVTNGYQRLFKFHLLSLDKTGKGYNNWEKDAPNTPRGFWPFSWDQIVSWPIPFSQLNGTLHYVPYPTALVNDTDVTTFSMSANRLVSIFAAYLASLKTSMSKAKAFLDEYNTRVVAVQEQERNNAKSRPAVMAPARWFDRQGANPEVGRFSELRGYY